MQKIVAFAIFSTRRQEEITLLRWDDLEEDRILVRDMKHPGDKKGNNVYCELPPEAIAIVKSMPRDEERIFPYSTDAISTAFTRACKISASKICDFMIFGTRGFRVCSKWAGQFRKWRLFQVTAAGPV